MKIVFLGTSAPSIEFDLETAAAVKQLSPETFVALLGSHVTYFDQETVAQTPAVDAVVRGEFAISGLTNRAMRRVLPSYSGSQMGRVLKRLRLHGIIKRIGRTYKYYLTALGRAATAGALKLRECIVLPALALAPAR